MITALATTTAAPTPAQRIRWRRRSSRARNHAVPIRGFVPDTRRCPPNRGLHTDTAEQASETVEGGAVVSERVRLRPRSHVVARPLLSRDARRCRRKFLEYFPDGFRDSVYLETERAYKLDAHKRWEAELGPDEFARLYADRDFAEIAARAVRIESRTNLLFSFEKMAVRDAVAQTGGAQVFADGLAEWIYGTGGKQERFDAWLRAVAGLPRRQTRVLTWP